MQIWKFELPEPGIVGEIAMPIGAEVLSADTHTHNSAKPPRLVNCGQFFVQYDPICMWAIVDPKAERETRRFMLIGTGWDLEEKGKMRLSFVSTIQQPPWVWHVFECMGEITPSP